MPSLIKHCEWIHLHDDCQSLLIFVTVLDLHDIHVIQQWHDLKFWNKMGKMLIYSIQYSYYIIHFENVIVDSSIPVKKLPSFPKIYLKITLSFARFIFLGIFRFDRYAFKFK